MLLFVCCTPIQENKKKSYIPKPNSTDYNPEARLNELGINLGTPSYPVANYVNVVRTGNLLFLSGKGPLQPNGKNIM